MPEVFSGPSLEYVDIVFLSLTPHTLFSSSQLLHLRAHIVHTHLELEVGDKPSERACVRAAIDFTKRPSGGCRQSSRFVRNFLKLSSSSYSPSSCLSPATPLSDCPRQSSYTWIRWGGPGERHVNRRGRVGLSVCVLSSGVSS